MKQITRITLASFFLIMVSCEDNNTNEEVLAEFGSISGTVTFSGSWPDSGEVLITLDTSYPPQGPPAAFSYITSDEILNGVYNYNFSDLSFRSYDAITVTYWSLGYGTAGTNYSLIGSYIEAIDVSQDTPDITIDMDATFD
tara:strand:- start:61 stop:483 length:423 start_codon:yes stop_codon:yes gene_type:complete